MGLSEFRAASRNASLAAAEHRRPVLEEPQEHGREHLVAGPGLANYVVGPGKPPAAPVSSKRKAALGSGAACCRVEITTQSARGNFSAPPLNMRSMPVSHD